MLRGLDRGGIGRLVEHIAKRIAVDGAGMGVDLRGLVEIRRLDDRVPAEGVHHIRLGSHAQRRLGGDWRVAHHHQRLGVLGPAPAAQHEHSAEREDGPAAAAKPLFPRPDLAIGKPQHPRHEKRQEEQRPHYRLRDEHEAACIPARIEWEEWPHAVVVRPVEQQVAERRNARGEVEPAPVDWLKSVPTLFICG